MKRLLIAAVCLVAFVSAPVASAQQAPAVTSGVSYGSLDWLWNAAAAAKKKRLQQQAAVVSGQAGAYQPTDFVRIAALAAEGNSNGNRHDRPASVGGSCLVHHHCDGDDDDDTGGTERGDGS